MLESESLSKNGATIVAVNGAAKGSAPTSVAPNISDCDVDPFEIVAQLSNGNFDGSDAVNSLTNCVLAKTSALGCILFRSVHETELLIPVGELSERSGMAHGLTSSKLKQLAAKSADQLAAQVISTRRSNQCCEIRRRATAPGGLVIWSTAILAKPQLSVVTDLHSNLIGDETGTRGPKLLGILTVIGGGKPQEAGSTARLTSDDLSLISRRFIPLAHLLLEHLELRETAHLSKRQTEKRIREMSAIYDIGRAIDRTELEGLFQLITEKAADVMEAQACSLMLTNEATDELSIAAAYGLPDDVVENTRVLIGQGIAGKVAQTGEAMMIQSDVKSDPRFKDARQVGLPGIASSITVPMVNDKRQVRGVLCIRRRTPSPPFTEDDKRLFSIFATQAGQAIKNARLYKDLRSRVLELSTIASLSETISSTLDLDFVLSLVADGIIQNVGMDRCCIYLREDKSDGNGAAEFVIRVSRGFDERLIEKHQTHPLITEAAERQIPIFKEHNDNSLGVAVDYADAMALKSYFAQPIVVRDVTIGVLVVSTDVSNRPIAFINLDLLSTFLQHAGMAIDNARLYAQMESRVRELHSLYRMSQQLTTTYGLSRACATVVKIASQMTHSDCALLMLFNDRLESLRIHDSVGLPDSISDMITLDPISADVSLAARALREPVHMHSVAADPQERYSFLGSPWSQLFSTLDKQYHCVLIAPLVTEDTVVGFVVLGRDTIGVGKFEDDTNKLMSIISSQAGAVLRSAALYEQSVEQRVLEMSALYELSRKVRTARSMADALNGILDIVSSVVWSDVAEIHTIDYNERRISRQAHRGETHGPESVGFEEKTIASWVLSERKAILITDIRSDTRFNEYFSADEPFRALMAIPIYFGDDVLAVLVVQASVSGVYNEDNVKMLSLIATQAASLFRDTESLRELTTYTDNILRSIAAAVVTLDADEKIVTLNLAAERILRTRSSALAGQTLSVLLDRVQCAEADADDIHKMVARAVETRQIVQCHGLKLFTSGEREPVTVNGSASQLLTERGDYLGVVLVFEDITKEDEMQEELIRISRLAEIGQLAAGIAHELRNPLASIKGAAQVLLGDLSDELVERHGEFLDIIVREVDGLNAVTTEFLEFSRPAPINWERFSIGDLLQRRLEFMAGEFGGMGITVEQSHDPKLPQIYADSNQLERAFVNLVLNAAQAMPEGGNLTVATTFAPGAKDLKDVGFAVLTISDSGIGIPKSRIEKIFAPFFTTKTKGTGLGLPLVQKIVESHGGTIKVDSEVGVGTTFTISLPVYSTYSDRLSMQNLPSAEITDLRKHGVEKRPLESWSAGLKTIINEEE